MTEGQIALHLGLSQIQIAVFETQIIVHVIIVLDVDRWCIRFGIQHQIGCEHLDLAGRQIFILGASLLYDALDADDIFASERICSFKQFLRNLIIKGHLHDAGFISQIHENQSAEVSSLRDPAVEYDFLPRVAEVQRAAHVRSLKNIAHISYFSCFYLSLHSCGSAERRLSISAFKSSNRTSVCSPLIISLQVATPFSSSLSPMLFRPW